MAEKSKIDVQVALASKIIGFRATALKTPTEKRKVGWFKTQIDVLDGMWEKLFEADLNLKSLEEEYRDHEYFANEMYDQAFTQYTTTKTTFLDAIMPGRNQSSMNTDRMSKEHVVEPLPYKNPLPPLALPKFSGKKEWEMFKGMFIALVHDMPTIPPILKLQYLAGSLEGEAKTHLPSQPLTAEKYDGAWKALLDRYDNEKYLLSSYISNVISCNRIKRRSLTELNRLVNTMRVSKQSINALQIPAEQLGELWLIHHISHKLDFKTLLDWETEAEESKGYPTYIMFLKFLEKQVRILDAAQNSFEGSPEQSKANTISAKYKAVSSHQTQISSSCVLCQGEHYLFACAKFKEMPVVQRLEFCKNQKLCLNCLKKGHFLKNCKSRRRCFRCRGHHHTQLHKETTEKTNSTSTIDRKEPTTEIEAIANHTTQPALPMKGPLKGSTILGTAWITLADSHHNQLKVRALIDPGSETSFVSERVLLNLSPKINKVKVSVTGVGALVTSTAHKEAMFIVKAQNNKEFSTTIKAYVLKTLTRVLPREEIDYSTWSHIKGLTLADPNFHKPDRIDCLLGADKYNEIMLPGLVKGPPGAPLAQHTVFGWILTGSNRLSNADATTNDYHTITEVPLESMLSRFWEIQEVIQEKPLTPEEMECEDYFKRTTHRNKEGRFVVRLPFKQQPSFDGSREIAVACLRRTEERLNRNVTFNIQYKEYISDYLDQHHMEVVPLARQTQQSYYVPHHAVPRHDNSNGIRLVFNASQRDWNKRSLNDVLATGPKLQMDITTVILRWRFYKWAYTADIKQMFRQILVHEEDRDWQRIVWREDSTHQIRDLRITTIVQGTASAPFLAIRVLKQLAEDGRNSHPHAASLLDHQVYVDDVFGGADEIQTATQQRNELINLLQSAGMILGKWSSNSAEILNQVVPAQAKEVPVGDQEAVSALGIKWLHQQDYFVIRQKASPPPTQSFSKLQSKPAESILTKRIILSKIAKLYDPLGWIAPVITTAKVILQDLWLNKMDWDQQVDTSFHERWTTFNASLEGLNCIKIPRWIGCSANEEWHLHGFADASKRSYAAVIYAVTPGRTSHILMAKTKLAPTSVQTLPRLELCGAELLVKLTKNVLCQLPLQPAKIYFWSDSKVVLDWLQGHPSRWPTFIANRVSTITSSFPVAEWRHVKSAENAADSATRGMAPAQLAEHSIWWHGTSWIIKPPMDWPISTTKQEKLRNPKAETQSLMADTQEIPSNEIMDILKKNSHFNKNRRILAYCARWRYNVRLKAEHRLKAEFCEREWSTALNYCFAIIQRSAYSKEIRSLQEGKSLHKRSNIARLVPFIDTHGIMRVGGRLEYAQLPYDERHPIILPGNNVVVRSYVKHIHEELLHGGPQLMLSHLYRTVWITQAPRIVSKVTRNCVKCLRYSSKSGVQQMAPLPTSRITPMRPFAIAGLDYAGPIETLFSKGRGAKRMKSYTAIFVCFVTRAIHIEVVSDLTSTAFLAAYSRFTARRGVCSKLYSDNATTFKGAAKELRQLFEETSEFVKDVKGQLALQKTEWSFIPPRAPHFGGLWEAAVRSFKRHFIKVIGSSTLTFEELSTLAAKIEACLNSRPLCPLSTNSTIPAALTPGHFLVGTPCLSPPEPINIDDRITLTNRWRLLTQLRNSFWTRWRTEVLHHLQVRNKWLKIHPNLKVGDLVIIKDELTPPATWPLGYITEVHSGKDGLTRTVTVKTATSSYTRPTVKLIKLPQEEELEANLHSKEGSQDSTEDN